MQKTPFYVRTKRVDGSFVDHESGIAAHGNNITQVNSPVGKQTAKFIKGGGLVICSDKEVAKAKAAGRVVENDVFTRKTKIKMVDAKKGSSAAANGMKVPVEVALDEDDLEQQAQSAAQNEEDNAHYAEVDDDEENDEDEDEGEEDGEPSLDDILNDKDRDTKKVKDGVKPAFAKTAGNKTSK